MGVNGGHSLTFRLCNLNFGQLVTIARYHHGDSRDGPPSIYIDSSWIARKFNGRTGGPIGAIIEIGACFTQEGYTTIARACVQKKCEIAFMNASDLATYAGKWCIGVSDFKLVKGTKKGTYTIGKASIFSTTKQQ
jgi:hypothetical protein